MQLGEQSEMLFSFSTPQTFTFTGSAYYIPAWHIWIISMSWLHSSKRQNGLLFMEQWTWTDSQKGLCSMSSCIQQGRGTRLVVGVPSAILSSPSSSKYSTQTQQKDLDRDLQPIPILTSKKPPYEEVLSAHRDPLCLCMHIWLKNTWLADTFQHGGNQTSIFPNAFAIWEHA